MSQKNKTQKNRKWPVQLYLYSNPKSAQANAYRYLGRTAKLFPGKVNGKKYSIFDKKNNHWVSFGQLGYEDYTKHHNKDRRKNYLTRSGKIKGKWSNNKYSANNLSRRILW